MAGQIRRCWLWCFPLAIAAGCAAEPDDSLSASQGLEGQVCGIEVLPSPQTLADSACDMGRTVYGPVRFERDTGKPQMRTGEFVVETEGAVCVSIRSGANGDNRISSGSVVIDGQSIAAPSDFNQKSDGLEGEFDFGTGSHTIDVEIASMPGSFVEVEVRERFPQLDTLTDVVGPNGALRLTNVATDHPLLTPNGDGHHDDTTFNADGEPLIELPGKEDGSIAYFLDWSFVILDLGSCAIVPTGIEGSTRVNSPTNVQATWDGTTVGGTVVPDGNYAYYVQMSLVREDGFVYDTVISPAYGMIIDDAPADWDESPEFLGDCDPMTDPSICRCPGGGGVGGSSDPNCRFQMPQYLVDLADPSTVDTTPFLSTAVEGGRYRVTADLREWNAGGLVYQNDGIWDSEAELRQWVSDLTGVPVGSGDSLFNFDYVQLGTSTAVTMLGVAPVSFNHLLLDAITDANGFLTIDGTTIDVNGARNDDASASAKFAVDGPRAGFECTEGGNTNGTSTLRSKFCAYNEGIAIGANLGLYSLRTTAFDVSVNGVGTMQDQVCVTNGVFACGIRTFQKPADTITVESQYYTQTDGISLAFDDELLATDIHAVSVGIDRDRVEPVDGVCARSVVETAGLRVRMDSADGTVPSTCVTNGVFF